jgi:hypothetical protein
LPVVVGKQVVGIVTNRDLRFETRLDEPVSSIMTPRERLVTVSEGAPLDEAKELMHRHRLERVLVVDAAFTLRGLITVKDILKSTEHPNASKDEFGKLRVGAAVGVGPDSDERIELLVQAGREGEGPRRRRARGAGVRSARPHRVGTPRCRARAAERRDARSLTTATRPRRPDGGQGISSVAPVVARASSERPVPTVIVPALLPGASDPSTASVLPLPEIVPTPARLADDGSE